MADEKIALYFVPEQEGAHVIGVPARDLTESEVAELWAREGAAMRTATTPNPTTGKALYQKSAPTGKRAERVEVIKETVAAGPTAAVESPPDAPAKGGEG